MRERERDEAFERERTLGKEDERSLFLSLLDPSSSSYNDFVFVFV